MDGIAISLQIAIHNLIEQTHFFGIFNLSFIGRYPSIEIFEDSGPHNLSMHIRIIIRGYEFPPYF